MPRKTKEKEEEKSNTKTTRSTKVTKSATNSKTASKSVASVKKTTASKKPTKKSTTTTKTRVNLKETHPILEYYDLPYRYNETVVKILAQTPNILFVYWDISDTDRKHFQLTYGDSFFENTKPVLLVHNETKHYTFEIDIHDFANSWYLPIQDANCQYKIELGRKPISMNTFPKDYIPITSSNCLQSPNDHILFENWNPKVSYRNLKNKINVTKVFNSSISSSKLGFLREFYQDLYPEEMFEEIENSAHMNLSSSSSSTFK